MENIYWQLHPERRGCSTNPYSRKPYSFPTKLLSLFLIALMLATVFQIPVHPIPLISVFNVQKEGDSMSANVRVDTAQLFMVAHLTRSNATLVSFYNASSGISMAQPDCAIGMVAPGTGEQPLRIPECGAAPSWEWWLDYCAKNPTYSACDDTSFVEWGVSLNSTPYSGSAVPAVHMHLSSLDAPNTQYALGLIAFFGGVLSFFGKNTAGFLFSLILGIAALTYQQIYGQDKNLDGSLDIYTPTDWTNFADALATPAFYMATSHIWWKISGPTAWVAGHR